ncbi:hypothetical protein ACH5RR_021296 [Cinchona calisaya]|uniref:Glabrous enhancer-binding protein-like DBD domain-containing protein n=1 Tax=Cinchona calisaya TaxID=153742 RepID=A0ABD2ZJS4_9GENT
MVKKLQFEDLNDGFDPQSNIGFSKNILAEKNAYPFLSYILLVDSAKNAFPTEVDPPWVFKKILRLRMKYLASLRRNISGNSSFNSPEEKQIFSLSDAIWGSDLIDNSANCLGEMEILDDMNKFRDLTSACPTDDYTSMLEFLKSLIPRGLFKKAHMIWCTVKEATQNSTDNFWIPSILNSANISPLPTEIRSSFDFLVLMNDYYHKYEGKYPFAEEDHMFNFTLFWVPGDSTMKEVQDTIVQLRDEYMQNRDRMCKEVGITTDYKDTSVLSDMIWGENGGNLGIIDINLASLGNAVEKSFGEEFVLGFDVEANPFEKW